MAQLTGSVGRGGVNNRFDVISIQSLLNSSSLPPSPRLATDGSVGPLTIAAIEAYQRMVVKGIVDGRVDVNGATFKSLNGDGICRFDPPDYSALIKAVDSFQETNGAGIIVVNATGAKTEVRGGPRRLWVWIGPRDMDTRVAPSPAGDPPAPDGFWSQWGSSILGCGSTAATGVVISLTVGPVGWVAGAFFANSALLCVTSIGKAIERDAWKEFEKQGGASYRTWMTVETLLSLIDLTNGVKGSLILLNTWAKGVNSASKLAKLKAAITGKKLTKNQLLAVIREIDPAEAAKIGRSSTRSRVLGVGNQVLADLRIAVSREKAARMVDSFGSALSLAGTPGTLENTNTWLVGYEAPAQPR